MSSIREESERKELMDILKNIFECEVECIDDYIYIESWEAFSKGAKKILEEGVVRFNEVEDFNDEEVIVSFKIEHKETKTEWEFIIEIDKEGIKQLLNKRGDGEWWIRHVSVCKEGLVTVRFDVVLKE